MSKFAKRKGTNSPSILHLLFIFLLFPFSLLGGVGAAGGKEYFQLSVMHQVWSSGNVEPVTGTSGMECLPSSQLSGCVGGWSRKKSKIDQIRAKSHSSLYIEHGGLFPGSPFWSKYGPPPYINYMEAAGLDAMTLTSREFTFGPPVVAQFCSGNFAIILSNANTTAEPMLSSCVLRRKLFYFPKFRTDNSARPVEFEEGDDPSNFDIVAVIGVELAESISKASFGNVTLDDTLSAVRRELGILTDVFGVNKIILGIGDTAQTDDEKIKLVMGLNGIDILLTSDQHSNTLSGSRPYPLVWRTSSGSPVLLVGTPSWGEALGFLNVTFDQYGVAVNWSGDAIELKNDTVDDPFIFNDVKSKYQVIENEYGQVAGVIVGMTIGEGCRTAECSLGNLLVDSMRKESGATIGLINSGSIRANLSGSFTTFDVLKAFPFQNFCLVFPVNGSLIISSLENSVSRAHNASLGGLGRFFQVSGIKFTWNINEPVGRRIINVWVDEKGDGSFTPISPSKTKRSLTMSAPFTHVPKG